MFATATTARGAAISGSCLPREAGVAGSGGRLGVAVGVATGVAVVASGRGGACAMQAAVAMAVVVPTASWHSPFMQGSRWMDMRATAGWGAPFQTVKRRDFGAPHLDARRRRSGRSEIVVVG